MKIEEIYDFISRRAFNTCMNNGIDTIEQLMFYRKDNKISNLRNCGLKTGNELENICLVFLKYKKIEEKYFTSKVSNQEMSVRRKELFERSLEYFYKKRSGLEKIKLQNFTSIEEVYNKGYINTQTFNICKKYKIANFKELISILEYGYYSFNWLYGCGKKCHFDLMNLCYVFLKKEDLREIYFYNYMKESFYIERKKELKRLGKEFKLRIENEYKNNNIKAPSIFGLNHFLNYTVKDLVGVGEKIIKLCRDSNIIYFSDLIDFYVKYNSFNILAKGDEKTIAELNEILKKYSKKYHFEQIKNIVENLTHQQIKVIESFAKKLFSPMELNDDESFKAKYGEKFMIEIVLDKIANNNFDIINSYENNYNYTTVFERKIEDYLIKIDNVKNELGLLKLHLNLWEMPYSLYLWRMPYPYPSDEFLEKFNLFELLDYVYRKSDIKDYLQPYIFVTYIYSNDYYNNVVSKELIKDKSKKDLLEVINSVVEILNSLTIFSNFYYKYYQNRYSIDFDKNVLSISNIIADKININENTFFSNKFIQYVFYQMNKDNYEIIGDVKNYILQDKFKSKNYDWKDIYIVKRKLVLIFDFDKFFNDVKKLSKNKKNNSVRVKFKDYLAKFLKTKETNLIEDISEVCEIIINEELELYLDKDKNLVIQNKYKYVYEVLDNIGKQASVKEITYWIKAQHPNYKIDEDGVRASLKRKYGFVPVGRSSIFGLKKWEKELNDFRGGTIKDIAKDYLIEKNTPIHINEILEEVHKYRGETSAKNVITNLKLDPEANFIVYNQSFIGLKSKIEEYNIEKYNNLPIQLGKTIIKLFDSDKMFSKQYVLNYLETNFKLTEEESNHIIKSLNV